MQENRSILALQIEAGCRKQCRTGDAMRTRPRNEFCVQTLDGLQEQYTVSRRVYAVRKDFPASFAVVLWKRNIKSRMQSGFESINAA